ncbi:RNA polymerase sigma factor [Streptosporangium sp. NBC_01639]|uniref:RNA polymerase sigma factor n=1 Tax=unclassified Streptosporangium TaxID=2632669 RepID=UPI002DDBBE2C|nr:RNA polymerase sigma factor [Streptosporangium sp. NBC_01756]WSC90699.1 RNA polymerase sigma factor [Streptosporangium sp. NBC_01756]WTD58895.1 RNA polymerase sigma factor [Streptosporangium sp. NBC_01639]
MMFQAAHPVGDAEAVRLSLDEPERFGAIFDRYGGEINRYVTQRLGGDSAEDIVAETFLTAFRKRGRYDPSRAGVRAWLYGIATNLIGRQRRVEVRTLRALGRYGLESDAAGHEERVAAQVSAESLRPSLATALAGLHQRDRDVLLLVALAGLSHEEIATALGIPYGTVGSRLNRARKKLRAALGDTNPMLEPEEADRG